MVAVVVDAVREVDVVVVDTETFVVGVIVNMGVDPEVVSAPEDVGDRAEGGVPGLVRIIFKSSSERRGTFVNFGEF